MSKSAYQVAISNLLAEVDRLNDENERLRKALGRAIGEFRTHADLLDDCRRKRQTLASLRTRWWADQLQDVLNRLSSAGPQ